jgi:tetratricopeptide (TPR) repeat protein
VRDYPDATSTRRNLDEAVATLDTGRGAPMDAHALLERYEALGDERDFDAARPLFEQELEARPTAGLFGDYGHLLYCHARRELRTAVEHVERAIELDADADKSRWQLIGLYGALQEPERAVAACEAWLAAAPDEMRFRRFLAAALVRAHELERADEVVAGGLALAPDDRTLLEVRGELEAARGHAEAALADWRRALELDPDDLGPLYGSAFLLEREGRIEEAAAAWERILEWHEAHEDLLHVEWPRQELRRLQGA